MLFDDVGRGGRRYFIQAMDDNTRGVEGGAQVEGRLRSKREGGGQCCR